MLTFLGDLYSPAILGLTFLVVFSLASNLLVFGVAVYQSRFHSGASRFFGLGVMLAIACAYPSVAMAQNSRRDNLIVRSKPLVVESSYRKCTTRLCTGYFTTCSFGRCGLPIKSRAEKDSDARVCGPPG